MSGVPTYLPEYADLYRIARDDEQAIFRELTMTSVRRSLFATLVIALVTSASVGLAAEQRVKVTMRDGMKIDTFFRTPEGNGPWPAVLKKGYGITTADAETFVKAGYAFVSQGERDGTCRPSGVQSSWRGTQEQQ